MPLRTRLSDATVARATITAAESIVPIPAKASASSVVLSTIAVILLSIGGLWQRPVVLLLGVCIILTSAAIRQKIENKNNRAREARLSFYGTGPSGLWRELESTTSQLTLDCEILALGVRNPDLEGQLVKRVTSIRHRIKELMNEFEALPSPGPNSSIRNVLSELQRLSEAILYHLKSQRTDAMESSLHESLISRLQAVKTLVLRELAGVSNGAGSPGRA